MSVGPICLHRELTRSCVYTSGGKKTRARKEDEYYTYLMEERVYTIIAVSSDKVACLDGESEKLE